MKNKILKIGVLGFALAVTQAEAQEIVYSEDFSSTTLGIGLQRDDVGFYKGASGAWEISGGMLQNSSLENNTVSEGAVACIIDLATLSNATADQFTLSFDYTLAEANETLYVHVWGYVDHSSSPTTSILNHGASNGNVWENASPAYMTAYNLGNINGVFNGTEGIASDAAVTIPGSSGLTAYSKTFDLSAFTTAPDRLGDYDYLVLAFTRNFGGTAPAATLDNVTVMVPTLEPMYTRDAGDSSWANLGQWNDNLSGSFQDSTVYPSTNDLVILSEGQMLIVDTNASVDRILISNAASLVLTNSAVGKVLTVNTLDVQGQLYQSDGTLNTTLSIEQPGEFHLTGGTFNSPVASDLSVDGSVVIDGGTLSQDLGGVADNISLTGSGTILIQSGNVTFPNGINTSVLNINTDVEIRGGNFNSTAQNRVSGEFKVVGDSASVQFTRLTAQASSVFVFELETSGVSPIVAPTWMGLASGSVGIDAGSYVHGGGTETILLFETANLTSLLDPANVSFTGFLEQGLLASITQSQATDEVNLVIKPYVVSPTVTYPGTADWSSQAVNSNDVVLIDAGAVITVDAAGTAAELAVDGVLLFKLGMIDVDAITLSSVLTVGAEGAMVVDGSDFKALDVHMPLIICSQLYGDITNQVSFVGFEGREPSVVVLDEGLWLRLVEPLALSARLCSLSPATTSTTDYDQTVFSATRALKPTGSAWGSLYDESVVMNTTLGQTVTDGTLAEINQSWEMTIGHGGQIASFRIPSLGETVPPQWQSDPSSAPWMDEVWQSVAIDQTLNGLYDNAPYFIHQAGVYPNKDEELTEAFYSPSVAAYVDEENRSFMMINWGQQAHLQIYTNSTTADDWRSDTLYFTGIKDLGQGVIEVSQGYYNYGLDTPNYFNMPWGGVRRTGTEYAFFSDPSGTGWTDPVSGGWKDGYKYKYYDTDGAMAFSATTNGSTPCLGLVFGQDPDPILPYQTANSQMRYGYAAGTFVPEETTWRNYFVISAIRRYELSQGRGVWSRYYFVLGDNLADLEARIADRNLLSVPSLEPFNYTEANTPLVAYSFTGSGASFRILENSTSPQFFLYAYPVSGSFPIYEILEEDETYHLTWDPYATGVIKTYDGTIAGIRLLGFARRTADVAGSSYSYESLDILMASASGNYIASGEALSARIATPFETWRVQHFGMTDDSGDGASTANPDNDTANNLAEYAFGGDPLDMADTGYVSTSGTLSENGTNWFEFVHPRRIGSESELEYTVESSSNLVSNDWKISDAIILPIPGTLDSCYEALTNRIDTTGKTNEFIRLKVQSN